VKIDLNDKVAIVTGGANGIGKAIVKLYLENGARVVIADVADEAGQKACDEMSNLGTCQYIHTDVTIPEQVNEMVDGVVQEFQAIDILVNNAGINIGGDRVDIDEFTRENWDKILAVDLNGLFYFSQAVSKIMIQQKSGRIINIGSVLGSIPARKQIAFVAAKAGNHNMTKAMALELAPHGILVNCVAPGSTLTRGTQKLFYNKDAGKAALAKRLLSHIPLGRPGKVEDIANAVLFLSGEESSYITGHVLTVDGGWTCGYFRDF
jgi:3-oxoacyl-[acyl-carrier protein] reductase